MPKPKPFVFNDQNQKNSYGFRILTSGISLKRFKNNPMMLNNHWNATQNVLGKWENVIVEKDLLLGEPVFDVADQEAAKVAGQVERGFINSCSMGITFNRDDLKIIGDELVMEKCELFEVSIVAVPSNANSIRLYSENGEILKDEEVKQLCLSLQTTQPDPADVQEKTHLKINPFSMKKIMLSAAVLAALSFDKSTPEQDVEEIEKRVLKLSSDLTEANAKLLKLETEKENAEAVELEAILTLAIKEGKFAATKKPEFEALGKANLALLKTTIEAIPAKVQLANKTVNVDTSNGIPTTKEEFQKLSDSAKLEFKNSNPEEYKKLFS